MKLLGAEISPLQLVLTRSTVGAGVTAIAAARVVNSKPTGATSRNHLNIQPTSSASKVLGNPKYRVKLAIRGLCIAASQVLTYLSLRYLPLGDTVAIQQLSGPLAAILAWLLLHERVTKNRVWGLATALLGVVLVAKPPVLMG